MDRSYDFQPPASSWLARAYYTPISDALRGRLSGRLDVRREIAAADLPQPMAGLIYAVVRRTRLWRAERIDVARELAAHFADGLAAGRTPQQLIETFGSPEPAAALIRKAKRRGRPLYWQAWWYVSRSLLVLLAVSLVGYGVLSARFYLSAPRISHNYWHEINNARRVPEAQRAWPLYRQAIFTLGRDDSSVIGDLTFTPSDGKNWPRLVAALERQQEPIKLVREASRKPYLGFLLGDPDDRAAARAAGDERVIGTTGLLADENQVLVNANMPHAQVLRELSQLLAADTRRAAIAGDGQTVLADLSALLAMSEQLFQPHATLVEQLVGIAIFGMAAEAAGRILVDSPAVLDDAQLRDLAHELAAYRNGSIRASFSGERDMFDDLLQRIYTDDGQGSGRLTPEGIRVLYEIGGDAPPALNPNQNLSQLTSPGLAAFVGTRQENRDLYESLMDDLIAAHQGSAWEWDYQATNAPVDRLDEVTQNPSGKLRYFLAQLMIPYVTGIYGAHERTIQNRDAVLVSIALVLWHRRHGQWPTSLDQLVPDLLPAVPLDRFDGQPLRYTLGDGRPIVYSVGMDRDDDGGRPSDPPENAMYSFGPLNPADAAPHSSGSENDGDWILFPPPPRPEEDEAE
jgi:hypothetical protein